MVEPDPIIEEIHAIREALSKLSGHDIRKIAEAAKARQATSGRIPVRLPPRKAKGTQKAS
jgi:formate-dependent phosphoribosylglycinamide formyltransferase (GAR transformylase)